MSKSTQAIILAAGKSSRFQTDATKLSYTICGQEMIRYSLNLLKELNLKTTVVVGYQKDALKEIISDHAYDVTLSEQTSQKGTGHALLCTKEHWSAEQLLIINGDAPLITQEHISTLMERHKRTGATVSLIASHNADPTIKGYGRVIHDGTTLSIVEQRDFTGDPEKECILNGGIYLIKRSFLEEALPTLKVHTSGEIYITDLIKKASENGHHVEVVDIPFDYVRGINTLKELWVAERLIRSQLIDHWMNNGVRFVAPESVIIDADVTIGSNTTIGYGVHLRKGTIVGTDVTIDGFSVLDRAQIAHQVTIRAHSVINNSSINAQALIGPFAHIHRNSICHEKSVVGNFVEISKSSLGQESKAKHLAYLGQTDVGKKVNIGAGTITCNYDGVSKHPTTIKDHAFIGSNSALLAPVTIGQHAIVAAGSTVTDNVPDNALAIARERQITKENYVVPSKKTTIATPQERS